ncbi:aldo/keto reductase [Streptococcus mutans]|uniref:aldo/keto reductase n=1 Tax=Streptococcus mutans TaxID=1309 RepID=UPI0018AC23FC|nr:aldo/keto reductase [Streptococcus mutans]MCB4986439.1 aldo/keto reductase [Streptococcus mutans]MDB8633975.1 aldo/keto reductase [Streptococcus mutans]
MKNLRSLGHSDLLLSPIGLGTWQFSNQGRNWWKPVSSYLVYDIIKASLQGRINWLDTAEYYGHGNSEKFIGSILKLLEKEGSLTETIYIADKWFPLLRSAKTIAQTFSGRLSNLQRPFIDLYQIHHPTSISSLKKQAEELANLQEKGLIKAIGVSNFSAHQMVKMDELLKSFGLRLDSNQVKYNLLHCKPERNGVLDVAKERGISLIAYSPLQQGVLTGRFHAESDSIKKISMLRRLNSELSSRSLKKTQPLIELLQKLADKYHKTPAQISLNWLIHAHVSTIFAIPGASSLKQAQSNLEAQNFKLTKTDLQKLSVDSEKLN